MFHYNYCDVLKVLLKHQIMSLIDLKHHYSKELLKNLNNKMSVDYLHLHFSSFYQLNYFLHCLTDLSLFYYHFLS